MSQDRLEELLVRVRSLQLFISKGHQGSSAGSESESAPTAYPMWSLDTCRKQHTIDVLERTFKPLKGCTTDRKTGFNWTVGPRMGDCHSIITGPERTVKWIKEHLEGIQRQQDLIEAIRRAMESREADRQREDARAELQRIEDAFYARQEEEEEERMVQAALARRE